MKSSNECTFTLNSEAKALIIGDTPDGAMTYKSGAAVAEVFERIRLA